MKLHKKLVGLLLVSSLVAGNLGFVTTVQAATPATPQLSSVTWQDPNNTVLQWRNESNCSYLIYRSETGKGDYQFIGTSATGTFRDDDVAYPDTYFYQIQAMDDRGYKSALSVPVEAGTNAQPLDRVTVIMYHDFITEQDIAEGVEFGEYALKPADFEADLQYLRSNGYTTITSADLADYIAGKKVLPPKALIISIDDGTQGVYDNCWPLLKRYKMKADFNLICERIDETWDYIHNGGSREGQSAPYCTWKEIIDLCNSEEINICSHTYGLHVYDRNGRIGAGILSDESVEEYARIVERDYELVLSSLTGWTGHLPITMAYPYSRRNAVSDEVILANTGYEILMAGESARGTGANYFVRGADGKSQLTLMSRPCRMDGYPIEYYLNDVDEKDFSNGVNKPEDTKSLTTEQCRTIAKWYSPYVDVPGDSWYAPGVYYAYVNSIMSGTSSCTFDPSLSVTRGMVATILYQLGGKPEFAAQTELSDLEDGQWYTIPARWAADNQIVLPLENGTFAPTDTITREQLVACLYRYAQYQDFDVSKSRSLEEFSDASSVSPQGVEAMEWALASGIISGNGDGTLDPEGTVSRAQLAVIIHNWMQAQQS